MTRARRETLPDAPDPAEIAASLARLRAAGGRLRRRPARATIEALAGVLDAWSAPRSALRAELARELPAVTGFSPETVREGLTRGLAPFRGDALERLVAHELGGPERLDAAGPSAVTGFETTAVLLAGALPTSTFPALVAPLVLRSPTLVKTAAHDPLTARLLARSIAAVDAELGACLEVVGFPGSDAARSAALLEAACVVATGADETVATVAAQVRRPRRLVAYGHRLSLAALGPHATQGDALARASAGLAVDVALWDQLGCLSPLAVYVVGPDEKAPDRVAAALARELARAQARWPRGRIDPFTAEAIVRERAEAEMRAAAGGRVTLHVGEGTAWTLVREADASPRPAPLHRFVRVHPVADAAGLLDALRPLAPHLAGVALAGFAEETPSLASRLAALGASRVCAPGALQTPPLDWPRDNRGLLVPLARFTSLELPGSSG